MKGRKEKRKGKSRWMDGWMEIFKVEKLRWILDERKVKSRGKLWMDG